MIIYIALIVFFIISAGFFSGIETGLVATNKIKIKIMEERGLNRAKIINKVLEKPDSFLSTTLIGTNISVVAVSILFTSFLHYYLNLSFSNSIIISTAALTPTLLIFGEVIPKSAFLANPTNFVIKLTYIFKFFYLLFLPISYMLMGLSRAIMYIFRIPRNSESFYLNKNTIQQIFQWGAKEGVLENDERDFVSSILATHRVTAREIMIPLVNVISIEIESQVSELVDLMEEHNISRIPVYEKRVDNIVGYVSSKELIYSDQNDTIKELMRECVYIPETKPVDLLLVEIQKIRVPIVFVVDEYGGCSGIITNEDIAEVIIGEILDEHEHDSGIIENEDGSLTINGVMDVDDLNSKYKLGIEKKGFETLAGYLSYVMGRIPDSGEKYETKKFRYTILEASDKSINKILIEKIEK